MGDGALYQNSDLFRYETRVGVNCSASEEGFFKKDYVSLKEDFSFALYVTLEDGIAPQNTTAFLGQGKSLFTVTFEKVADDEEQRFGEAIQKMLRPGMAYCFGDLFMRSENYKNTRFAITELRDYRVFATTYGRKGDQYYQSVHKDSVLYKTIKAGSVFLPKNEAFMEEIADRNAQVVGFNILLRGEK